MDLMEFASVMTQRGCVGSEKNFCGSYGGYPFSVTYLNGKTGKATNAMLKIVFAEKVPANKIYKELQKRYKLYTASLQPPMPSNRITLGVAPAAQTASTPNSLCLTIGAKTAEEFGSFFDWLLREIALVAPTFGLHISSVCPMCNAPGCDSYAYVKDAYRPTHLACVQAMTVTTQAEVAVNEQKGSYALGILGALLGALLGNIPNILLMVFLQRTYVYVYALIPLGAYYGYKLLGGKMSGATVWIVSLFSVLTAPLSDVAAIYMYVYKERGIQLSLKQVFQLMGTSEMLGEMALSLLFVVLGIYIVFSIIRRTNKHTLQDASFTHATLRPIEGMAPPQAAAPYLPENYNPQ